MANQEHLDILRQGVGVWNEWRQNYPGLLSSIKENVILPAEEKASELEQRKRG